MLSVKKEINWPMQFIVVQNPTCVLYPKGISQCLNKGIYIIKGSYLYFSAHLYNDTLVVKYLTVSDFLLKRDNTEKPEMTGKINLVSRNLYSFK